MAVHSRSSWSLLSLSLWMSVSLFLVIWTSLPVSGVELTLFYPFGAKEGDEVMSPGDETSSEEINLQESFVLYNQSFKSIYVNTNGHVSFDSDVPAYRSHIAMPLGAHIVAAFFADIDTRGIGRVYYRNTSDQAVLERAAADVQIHFSGFEAFMPKSLFIATWDRVGYFSEKRDKVNTFQIVLATDGTNTFAFFHYLDDGIQWRKSDGKFSPAYPDIPPQAGFEGGKDGSFFLLDDSGVTGDFVTGSNINVPGVWMFRIGFIETGNVVPADLNTRDEQIFVPENAVEGCLQSSGVCSANAECFDHSLGFCCVCVKPYYGNGLDCLEPNRPQTLNGRVVGSINGVPLDDDHYMHTYVETKDGRTHSSISRVPRSIAPGLQTLNSISGIVGWLFALRSGSTAKNGFQYTGARFNRTARVTFQADNRTDMVLRIYQTFQGFASPNNIRMETRITGNMPDVPADATVVIDDYNEVYEKTGPGLIRSFAQRNYHVNDVAYRYMWENTINFEECEDDSINMAESSMRLEVSRVYHNYDASQMAYRFGMWSRILESGDDDPCASDANNCDVNAECDRDGSSFRCTCRRGYDGDGVTCEDVDECLRDPCTANSRCVNEQGTFRCECLPGFSRNGLVCQRDVQLCGNSICDDNARCVFVDDVSQPVCQCNSGFRGDGQRCVPVRERDCREVDMCGENAQCVFDDLMRKYTCECLDEFSGDGFECERIDQGCDACHPYAECVLDPMRDRYTCRCREGYTGDGRTCTVIETCGRCDRYARCVFNEEASNYQCVCVRGYEGDGQTCTRADCRNYDNLCAEEGGLCWLDPRTNKGICRCNYGYRGDGFRCDKLSCDVYNFCDKNAKCAPEGEEYVCKCDDGYVGDGRRCRPTDTTCDVYNDCDRNARCLPDRSGAYACQCNQGFEGDGKRCEEKAEVSCNQVNNCDNYAECMYDPDRMSYRCVCRRGYEGDGYSCRRREDYDCRRDQRLCSPNAECVPGEGENYRCVCRSGYRGDGATCTREDVDCRRDSRLCSPNAECVPGEDESYNCVCRSGYRGDGATCTREDVDCRRDSRLCSPNAECVPGEDESYNCVCRSGYRGDGATCNREDADCRRDPRLCSPNAECVPGEDESYNCVCRSGYRGDGATCTPEDVDCRRNRRLCSPNAECLRGEDESYSCVCRSGYRGDGATCTQEADCRRDRRLCSPYAECVRGDDESYKCECRSGYRGDGATCTQLIDCRRDRRLCSPNAECVPGIDGSYTCVCGPGYRGDGSTCTTVVREGEYLVYGQGNKLMRVSTNARPGDMGQQLVFVPGQLAVGIDTDCDKGHLYWTDAAKGLIRRSRLDGSEMETVISGLKSPEGIAIDFSAGNMFYTDSELDILQVAKLDGSQIRTLVDVDVYNPRAIVLDINKGTIYWTDWHRFKPQIEKVNMDGTEREIFVSDNLRLPNGLSFDTYSQQLCWCDAGSKTIECIRTDGSGRRVIYDGASHPFDLAILNNAIFWSDWQRRNIPNVNKNGQDPNQPLPLAVGGHGRLYGITAVRDQCPRVRNSCALNNGGCSHLCLPSPNGGRTCACPDGVDPRICQQ